MADTTSTPVTSHVDKNTIHHVDDVKLQEKTNTDTESLASVDDEPVGEFVPDHLHWLTKADDIQEVHG